MALVPSTQRHPKRNPPVGTLILAPSLREVSRKSRHSKVRSGCTTCKQRKVKCDEAKPECLRCTKIGKICGGYEDLKPLLFEPQIDSVCETSSDGSTKPRQLQATKPANRFAVVQTHCYAESDVWIDNASYDHSSIPTWPTFVDSYMSCLEEYYSAGQMNGLLNLFEFGLCAMPNLFHSLLKANSTSHLPLWTDFRLEAAKQKFRP